MRRTVKIFIDIGETQEITELFLIYLSTTTRAYLTHLPIDKILIPF